jgi:hypothetical protein
MTRPTIESCQCGVPVNVSHYCSSLDHSWVPSRPLASAVSAPTPQGCINCGIANDGGYVIGNEEEDVAGPFCSSCFGEIEEFYQRHFTSAVVRAPGPRQEEP